MAEITVEQMRQLWLAIESLQKRGYEIVGIDAANELDGLHVQLMTRLVDLNAEQLQREDTDFVLR